MILEVIDTNLREVNDHPKTLQNRRPLACSVRAGIACHSKNNISPEFKNVNIGFE
jgi:hypothetical protein